jgi:hypothetical protein
MLGRQRVAGWERLSWGLYVPRVVHRTLLEELQGWDLVLPRTAAFTHLTVAELRGWWLPGTPPHPVFAAMGTSTPRPRRAGLLVCRHPKPVPMTWFSGLRITTPAETLLAAARDLGLLDLVVMGDSALREGDVTIGQLKITAAQRRRGAPLLRQVIPLLDKRSESAWESIMRVLHVAAEVPVEPQYKIFDDRGRFVARADPWVTGTQRIQEYDGGDHREPDVHQRDLVRERRLLAEQWERYGYTSVHLLNDAPEIIHSLDEVLARPWDARRLYAWRELINTSMLGRRGRARALAHWRRAQ